MGTHELMAAVLIDRPGDVGPYRRECAVQVMPDCAFALPHVGYAGFASVPGERSNVSGLAAAVVVTRISPG